MQVGATGCNWVQLGDALDRERTRAPEHVGVDLFKCLSPTSGYGVPSGSTEYLAECGEGAS